MNSNIQQKQVVKFLGVYIDDQLEWKFHTENVRKKIQQGNRYIIYKVKFLVPQNFLKNLYSSFIQSHITYGNLAWASSNTNMVRINKLIFFINKIRDKNYFS